MQMLNKIFFLVVNFMLYKKKNLIFQRQRKINLIFEVKRFYCPTKILRVSKFETKDQFFFICYMILGNRFLEAKLFYNLGRSVRPSVLNG